MSDLPPPQLPSVVLDADASVKVRRWPAIAAAFAATAFVVYFVLALTLESSEPYVMGPVASDLQDKFTELVSGRSLSTDELRCTDDAATDLDPAALDELSGDFLSGGTDDPAVQAFAGRVMDDCFRPESRQALLATEMTADGTITADQAACLSAKVDESVMNAGGYTTMIADPSGMGTQVAMSMLGSFEACGLSIADLMGG